MFKWDALTKGPSASRPSTHTETQAKEKRKESKGRKRRLRKDEERQREMEEVGGRDEGQYWTWDRNPFSVFCARLAIVWLCGSQRPLAANSRLGWKFNEGFNHYERPGILLLSLSLFHTHIHKASSWINETHIHIHSVRTLTPGGMWTRGQGHKMGQKTINILKQKEGLDLSKAGPELFRHHTHTQTHRQSRSLRMP